jgi:O-antigen/teichoic acid export membrane protein
LNRSPSIKDCSAVSEHNNAHKSLKKNSIYSVIWSMGGHGAGEAIRLASNLILTRMLIPDDFGLMLMVNVFLMGLQLFSDVGIGPSIIQHRRGEDVRFLNTAWTIQVIRGFVLWIVAALLAYPVAYFYDMPRLAELIPVAAVAAIISGFNSTKVFSLNRKLNLGKITVLEIGKSLISVAIMITGSYFYPSVWAMVAGGIGASLFFCISSHFLTSGQSNRFAWDHSAFRELFVFGRWIVFSTAIGFFATRGDRLMLAKVMTESELGMLSIALVLSRSIIKLISDIGRKVLFPLYARLAELDPVQLRNRIAKVKVMLMAVTLPLLCGLTVWGGDIINLLWDSRYKDAGWMLQILSAGGIFGVINNISLPVLLALGDSFRHLISTAARSIILALAVIVGVYYGGAVGALIGVAVTPAINYVVLAMLIRRYNAWLPLIDMVAFLSSFLLIVLGLLLSESGIDILLNISLFISNLVEDLDFSRIESTLYDFFT